MTTEPNETSDYQILPESFDGGNDKTTQSIRNVVENLSSLKPEPTDIAATLETPSPTAVSVTDAPLNKTDMSYKVGPVMTEKLVVN